MRAPLHNIPTDPHPDRDSLKHKLQDKIAESRFFAISLCLHLILVLLAGTYAIYRVIEDKDFTPANIGEIDVPASDQPIDVTERPPERSPKDTVMPPPPPATNPALDMVTVRNASAPFSVPRPTIPLITRTPALDVNELLPKAGIFVGLTNVPISMQTRFKGRVGRMAEAEKIGMKPKSEDAVVKGLEWLRLNQSADGTWGERNKGAMTGLALLCFLGHGETPGSEQYGVTINRAVDWFIENGTKSEGRLSMENSISQQGAYEHGIATYALGEYYTITNDQRVLELYTKAVEYIVNGQGPGGGWAYGYSKTGNDLSLSGWQIQALKAAYLTRLKLPGVDAALDRAILYLENDQGPKGGYGYGGPEDRYSLTGVGILSRLFWNGDKAKLKKGMTWLLDETANKPVKYKGPHADLYAWYYHTQACLMFGDPAWTRWNHWFQDELVAAQNADGSWPFPGATGVGPQGEDTKTGAVYRTALCILMLEAYYRYSPINKGG